MISIFESLASGDNPPKLDSDDSSDDSDEDSHVDEDDNDEEAMAYEEEEEGILDKADLEADELSRPRSRVVHRKIKATVLGNYCCFCSRLCFHRMVPYVRPKFRNQNRAKNSNSKNSTCKVGCSSRNRGCERNGISVRFQPINHCLLDHRADFPTHRMVLTVRRSDLLLPSTRPLHLFRLYPVADRPRHR